MNTDSDPRPRRRDAAATREALLTAARTLMAQHGVEGTSTRDVATAAGVNQALVYRYFGSKEKLFAEAASDATTTPDTLMTETPLADLPAILVARVLDMTGSDNTSISTLVAAANDDTIRDIIRDRIISGFDDELAPRLDGPDAALRAELFAALITGIGFLHRKIGTPAILAADRETLIAHVDNMVKLLLTNQP
ncbi:AcrR family transcriptional regulator [Kibdelosporangium banguiense]|uniref:AcrR family transcriptional regulator n=1 Tax=Kibdelosporangium banguiense TaxID=1365924 RepID=A0ABS4U1M0_9PSEU|nr:TetR/AcrR family transcriptional regulator [Kibdelosporangium banguiense]MBP2330553.1 AcrR family transcriptional regulator [Kibdelosporangium banguiense]